MPDRKTIRNFYKSRFIDSLEQNIDKWEAKYCGGGPGWSWTEWHGPEYTNDEGERIQFFSGLNYTGAYINGRVGYAIGRWEWIMSRRLRKAFRNMKSHVKAKERKKVDDKMMKAL